jgi:hypothetical protein
MLPVNPCNHEAKQPLSPPFLFRTYTQAESRGIQTEGSLPFTQKSSVLGSTFSMRPLTTQYAVTVATPWQTSGLLDILLCHSDADVDSCLPGYDSMYSGQAQPIFRRNLLPSLLQFKCRSTADVLILDEAEWRQPI